MKKTTLLLSSVLCVFYLSFAGHALAAPRVAYIDIAPLQEYLPHKIYEPGQVCRGHVSVEEASGSHTVCIFWLDAYGRISGADTVQVGPPVFSADFSIALQNPLSFYNRLESALDGVMQTASVEFNIRPASRRWDDYYSAVWAGYQYEYFPALRQAGINTHMVYKDFPYYEQVVARDFDTYVDNICWRVFAPYHKWRYRWNAIKKQVAASPYNMTLLTRIPSFEDPATEEAIRSTVQQIVNYHKPHRPIFYNLADEIGIGDQSGVIDFDHTVFARNAFIDYLRNKYATVDALNRQWETEFISFYEAAGSTETLTDRAMDRIWEKELPKAFARVEEARERFGVHLGSLEDYVALNALLKSTPPKSVEEIERLLPRLKSEFNLSSVTAEELAAFAGKFHEWTTGLSVSNPRDWNLSPWADHKDFMDRSMARALGKAYEYARQADPEGVFGFTGGHSPGAFAGYNLEFLSRVVDLQVPYNLADDVEILRSLNKKLILLSPTWGTDERGVRTLWYQFFHNDHGVIFWDNDEPQNKFIDKKTGELTNRARVFQPDLHELTGGIGKLILGSERMHDRIAVLYSHPSIRVHWMIQHLHLGREWTLRESWHEFRELYFNQVHSSLLKLIEDHFLQYDFVSYKQVEEGKLDEGEYDILFLPQTIAVSDCEARAVERFVARGGTVVADCRLGLTDESGKCRKVGALDKIFGICCAEGGTGIVNRVTDSGAVKEKLAGVPIYINSYGKGKAIYLDRSLDDYYMLRTKPGKDAELYNLFGAVLARAGVKPAVRVSCADGSRLPGTELVRYQNGEQTVLALFRNPQMRVIGTGGTEKVDNSAFEKTETVSVKLPAPAHVYNVRGGGTGEKYLGRGSVFKLTLDPWRPTILTVSSRHISSLDVTPSVKEIESGRPVSFSIDLKGADPTSEINNIINVRVTGPHGLRLYHYDSNFGFTGTEAKFCLPFAVNDPAGQYRVAFRHISTALEKEIAIDLKP
ncbi:MAG TPA: beta-galactosidase trimerization domain-containing protein [archaeon]|nr:beta-galactosidase trimerization domain-containing protein [archaeon]